MAGVASIWLSSPSWGNHGKVFEAAGLKTQSYTYLDQATKTRLDFDGLCRDLESKVPKGSVVLLHACAHNPTGVDPSLPQWEEIAQIFAARSLVPLFDSAYQVIPPFNNPGFVQKGHNIRCHCSTSGTSR